MGNPPIDLIYTWVDGSDRLFSARLEKFKSAYLASKGALPDPGSAGPDRFRDFDNLRFSLRSVEQNAPWFRKIFIVTNGQQTPRWLNKNPRVKIITHEEIFTDSRHLPTFSSCAIEMHLHRIPELSRFFLYLNDDVFITRSTSLDYFFGKNGLPKILLAPWGLDPNPNPETAGLWYRQLAYLVKLLNERFGPNHVWYQAAHGPILFDRHELERIYAIWPENSKHTSEHKFREETDFLCQPLYANSLAALDEEGAKEVAERHERIILDENEMRVVPVGDTLSPWRDELNEIVRNPPRFLCLNDAAPIDLAKKADVAEIEKVQRQFLEKIFPAPSAFELRA